MDILIGKNGKNIGNLIKQEERWLFLTAFCVLFRCNCNFAGKVMTYSGTIDYLYNKLPMFSRMGASAFKKDLANIRALCAALGNPQNKFKSVHVAGTNGKGSVCHMLAAIFQKSGYKTGLHTSPHLVDFRERIRIDGKVVAEDFVVDFVEKNLELIEKIKPSFFEISVAMAFYWFAENKVDVAVIEVGLGGRLDSTNILLPELSVITNISLEHTQFLGNTRSLIAGEKAGIIKPHVPVVVGELDEETEDVYIRKADEMNAPLTFATQVFKTENVSADSEGQLIKVSTVGSAQGVEFKLDLGGMYQLQNIRTVLCAVDVLKTLHWQLPDSEVKEALTHVKQLTGLRGRWEILGKNPLVVADTSHNTGGIKYVMAQVNTLSYKKLHIVTGFVKDKNVLEILELYPKQAVYYFCQADNPRALPAAEIWDMAKHLGLKGEIFSSVHEAYETARKKALPEDVVLITGSTFIVAEVLQ